ncbi:MAG: chemotaxis protein CheD [Mangrovibacterium sp.]|nr:chemotaxis protein CheD [Mangrovibacterium sp.]
MDQVPYYLHPSTIVVRNEGRILTVLGSCVAVCLFDVRGKRGGMNHYMLPFWNGEGLETPRYGNVAIPKLIFEMLDGGSRKKDLTAKVFGGASVLSEGGSVFQTGEKNIVVALRLLEEFGIPVVASSTGGSRGRRIWFNPSTGEVLQQYTIKTT